MYFAVSPLLAPAWGEGLGRWRGFPQASTINNCQKSNKSTFHKSAGNRIKGRNAQLTELRPVCRSYPFWVPHLDVGSIHRYTRLVTNEYVYALLQPIRNTKLLTLGCRPCTLSRPPKRYVVYIIFFTSVLIMTMEANI